MFRFDGRLIDGKAAYLWLSNGSSDTSTEISICSAFLRSAVIQDFSLRYPSNSLVRVMVRWRLSDLLTGASDLESYKICAKLGWKFYVHLNFHGKVFHLPTHGILVGSANATESGFGLLANSNSEVCTIVDESVSNVKFVNNLFDNAIEMTVGLFSTIEEAVNQSIVDSDIFEWPDHVKQHLMTASDQSPHLFLSECFKTNGEELLSLSMGFSSDALADLSLLGLSESWVTNESIARQFVSSKIFLLLTRMLKEHGGELYFGTVTSALHDWLIEDPTPYRREVKVLVKNLYSWIDNLGFVATGMVVDRPNHSERIRLV